MRQQRRQQRRHKQQQQNHDDDDDDDDNCRHDRRYHSIDIVNSPFAHLYRPHRIALHRSTPLRFATLRGFIKRCDGRLVCRF